jgi:hypothetical protein
MRVVLLNNEGQGFAGNKDIQTGTTIAQFFRDAIGGGAISENYTIRVNREGCTPEQVLQEGDRVSITPRKIEGA